MPGDRAPFRKSELTDEQAAGSHTLRRYLTVAQDKQFLAKGLKIREEYEVANNDDVVLVLVQQWIADGKEADLDRQLVAEAKKASIAKRTQPFS